MEGAVPGKKKPVTEKVTGALRSSRPISRTPSREVAVTFVEEIGLLASASPYFLRLPVRTPSKQWLACRFRPRLQLRGSDGLSPSSRQIHSTRVIQLSPVASTFPTEFKQVLHFFARGLGRCERDQYRRLVASR